MRVDSSKDMSVRVSASTCYDFNALTNASCVEVVALVRRECYYEGVSKSFRTESITK
jgi:hypothetical protein